VQRELDDLVLSVDMVVVVEKFVVVVVEKFVVVVVENFVVVVVAVKEFADLIVVTTVMILLFVLHVPSLNCLLLRLNSFPLLLWHRYWIGVAGKKCIAG